MNGDQSKLRMIYMTLPQIIENLTMDMVIKLEKPPLKISFVIFL